MPPDRDRDRDAFEDMLFYARDVLQVVEGRSEEDLEREWILAKGLERVLQNVGEAANRVSHPTRAEHPEIPWMDIIGMRHHLVHEYDDIEHEVIWKTITEDLPPLIAALEKLLAEHDPGQLT